MTSAAIRELFDALGVELLTANRYEPPSLASTDVRRTVYWRRNRGEFENLAARFAEARFPELEVRHIGGLLGYGLFALTPVAAGDFIGEYTGIVRPARPGRPLPGGGYTSDYAWGFPGVRTLGRALEIDAREAGGLLRFANHAGVPTAAADHFAVDGRWRVAFVAVKAIPAGGEITVDYGDAYWSGGERELIL